MFCGQINFTLFSHFYGNPSSLFYNMEFVVYILNMNLCRFVLLCGAYFYFLLYNFYSISFNSSERHSCYRTLDTMIGGIWVSDFSRLLAYHIHGKDIKTYALAQYVGLDRSNMYKIINGSRKPTSVEMVNRMSKFMHLSPSEHEEFKNAYLISLIGPETYNRRKCILDFFENFYLPQKKSIHPGSEISFPASGSKIVALHSQSELNRFLLFAVSSQLKKPHSRIRVMIQPDYDFLVNLLDAANNNCSSVEIEHIICLDNSPSVPPGILQNYNINCLKKLLPLYGNHYKYNCYYYYDNIVSKLGSISAFPYMIIAGAYACLIDRDMQSGIATSSDLSLNILNAIFDESLQESSPLLFQINGASEQLKDLYSTYAVCQSGYSFQSTPCLTPLLTRDLLEKYVLNDQDGKAEFIDFLSGHLADAGIQKWFNSTEYIFSLEGMKKFLETGRIGEYPYEMYDPIALEDRIVLAERFVNSFSVRKTRMLRRQIGSIDSELYLFVSPQKGYLMFPTPVNNRLIFLNIKEPGLLFSLLDFCSSLDDDMFFSKEEAVKLLEELIASYK